MAFRSLVSAVSEQCQEIRQTLPTISYFSAWDGSAIAECSRLSSLAEFPPKEIILGSGTGNSHTVYFILDGVCRMIQYLQVERKTDPRGETKYNLYKSTEGTMNGDPGSIGYASLLLNEKHEFQREKIIEQDMLDGANTVPEVTKLKDELLSTDKKTETRKSNATNSKPEGSSDVEPRTDPKEGKNSKTEEGKKKEKVYEEDHHARVLEECKTKLQNIIWVNKKDPTRERPKTVSGYFIQTGFLFKGACFGLKKYTEKNFIMSETRVKCLKIPRRFLLQHNPCNIWNRILLFDSLYQPKEEKILECFQTDRKWLEEFKEAPYERINFGSVYNAGLLKKVFSVFPPEELKRGWQEAPSKINI